MKGKMVNEIEGLESFEQGTIVSLNLMSDRRTRGRDKGRCMGLTASLVAGKEYLEEVIGPSGPCEQWDGNLLLPCLVGFIIIDRAQEVWFGCSSLETLQIF